MSFKDRRAETYRRLYEFHKRHEGARTEAELSEMSEDAGWFDDEFKAALLMAVLDEIERTKRGK